MNGFRNTTPPGLAVVAPLVVLPWLAGCSFSPHNVEVAKLGPANKIEVYKGGQPVIERGVAEGSDEEKAVTSWLRSHSDGWRADFNTYAPFRRVISADFTLDFWEDRCILNYRTNEKGDWSQVSRPVRPGEAIPEIFAELR